MTVELYAGTSGYSYKEWKGSFYPENLPAAEMLRYYGACLPAVEINNTFYRLPKVSMLTTWAEQVPENFRFAIKASRRITHIKRLKDAQDETSYLLQTVKSLGPRLGVVLFQLPPYLRKDVARLKAFLDTLPDETPAAFEFRDPSWFEHGVFELLQARNFALCLADADDETETTLVRTATWGYVRLRRAHYGEAELTHWVDQVRAQRWERAYVFFKHEDEGAGPKLAARFLELATLS
ncbi:MAG: DUF72 domain-containing protein [Acidiferrobacterales bacterium]